MSYTQVQLGLRQRGQAEVPGDTDDERAAHWLGNWGAERGLLGPKGESLCGDVGHGSFYRDISDICSHVFLTEFALVDDFRGIYSTQKNTGLKWTLHRFVCTLNQLHHVCHLPPGLQFCHASELDVPHVHIDGIILSRLT